MPKKIKAQGLSINTIILVVIGLIVLVIIIAILTGRMGLFSKGLESATSCENTCKALGRTRYATTSLITEQACKDESGLIMPGDYGISEGYVCCCVKSDTTCTKKKTDESCALGSECCSGSCDALKCK